MKLLFLGTGTSVGVPQIGCDCRVCKSADPRDRRRRCGVYVTADDGSSFVIDTPPEFREACLLYAIKKVDAVLLTHAHMDHVAGFDDVRRFNTINGEIVQCDRSDPYSGGRDWKVIGKPLPCYASLDTISILHHIFPYITNKAGQNGLYRPQINFIDNSKPFCVGSIQVEAFAVEHKFPCNGYIVSGDGFRIGYASDCGGMAEDVKRRLRGVDVMIIDCLRKRPHSTHFSLEGTLECLAAIGAKRSFITHMCHDLSHEEWCALLPDGVEPAYDGLIIERT